MWGRRAYCMLLKGILILRREWHCNVSVLPTQPEHTSGPSSQRRLEPPKGESFLRSRSNCILPLPRRTSRHVRLLHVPRQPQLIATLSTTRIGPPRRHTGLFALTPHSARSNGELREVGSESGHRGGADRDRPPCVPSRAAAYSRSALARPYSASHFLHRLATADQSTWVSGRSSSLPASTRAV